jgi:hypothetical protein
MQNIAKMSVLADTWRAPSGNGDATGVERIQFILPGGGWPLQQYGSAFSIAAERSRNPLEPRL